MDECVLALEMEYEVLTIDIFAVSNPDDMNNLLRNVNLINYTIIS